MAAFPSKNKTSLRLEILDNFTKYICRRIQYDVIDSWLASLVVTSNELCLCCSDRASENETIGAIWFKKIMHDFLTNYV